MESETVITSAAETPDTQRHKKLSYEKLNLLTKRSHERDKCELCENVGCIRCTKCRVTYYCGVEHMNLDKEFHNILCSRVKELRKPIEFSPQSETRERWLKQRRIRMEELYRFTWQRGQAELEEGKYDAAIPAATESTKYAQELFGQSPEMIPPLLITAESYLNKGKLPVADGFVARALSIETTWGEIRPYIKARIRRNEGLIHLARNKLNDALDCFAEEIYQSTEEFGPYHIRTSGGYCYLGHVFHLKRDFETSASLFRQTVQIWHDHIVPILAEMTAYPTLNVLAAPIKTEEKVWMEDSDKYEGLRLLTKCYAQQQEIRVFVKPKDLIITCYSIAVMNYICERYAESKNKCIEGQNRVLQSSNIMQPISFKFNHLIRFCDRKLENMEKNTTCQSSETDLSVI